MRLSINKKSGGILQKTLILLTVCLSVLLVACSSESEDATTDSRLRVVASNGIVADWISNVGGDKIDVATLVPVGADPHTFQPGARDVTLVADADMIFTIGLGLEASWMTKLIQNASVDTANIVELGNVVSPLSSSDEHDAHDKDDDHDAHGKDDDHDAHGKDDDDHDAHEKDDDHDVHDHGVFDPHFWMDPVRVKTAISEIARQLGSKDTVNLNTYNANEESYNQKLEDLHIWAQEQMHDIPENRKVLITSHDSLQYFAKRYHFNVIGTVIQGLSTERDPSPSELANLEDIITDQKVNAIFSETTVSPKLAEMLAQETGAKVFELYSGSLGPEGSSADTYIGMMRDDIGKIVEALQ